MKKNPEQPVHERLELKTLPEHLIDFRRRVLFSLLAVLAGFIVAYIFAPDIYGFLVRPLAEASNGEARRLIYTGLAEAFITYIKLAFWAGSILALPVIATQIWMFVAPGLYRHERRVFLPFLIASPLLFLAGAAMAYYLVFPLAWKFFLGFELPASSSGLPIQLEARVSEYLSLSMGIIFAFGLAFQLPIALVLLTYAGLLSAARLSGFRRYAIVLIFAVAAVITPPDVISQISLAIPMVVLYEVSIFAAKLIERNKREGIHDAGKQNY